jgi:hypothetical protein
MCNLNDMSFLNKIDVLFHCTCFSIFYYIIISFLSYMYSKFVFYSCSNTHDIKYIREKNYFHRPWLNSVCIFVLLFSDLWLLWKISKYYIFVNMELKLICLESYGNYSRISDYFVMTICIDVIRHSETCLSWTLYIKWYPVNTKHPL